MNLCFRQMLGLALIALPQLLHAQLTPFQRAGKWGFKNASGNEVVAPKYVGVGEHGLSPIQPDGTVVNIFSDGLAPVTATGTTSGIMGAVENGKWGFIDASGKEVVPMRYDEVANFKNGYAVVTLGGKKGLVGKSGKEMIPVRYDAVQEDFSDGLAAVKTGDLWGYVSEQGKEVIAPRYYGAEPFSEGLAAVVPEAPKAAASGVFALSVYGFIDKSGKLLIPASYKDPTLTVRSLNLALRFDNGQARVSQNGKVLYINRSGQPVAPSLKHQLYDLYADSYKSFSHSMGALVREDTARKQKFYAPVALAGSGTEVIGVKTDGRALYALTYDLSNPTQAAAAQSALPVIKAFIDEVIRQGWDFKTYVKDYKGDAEGNEVLLVLQQTQGLPDPRTTKITFTNGAKKVVLTILNNQ